MHLAVDRRAIRIRPRETPTGASPGARSDAWPGTKRLDSSFVVRRSSFVNESACIGLHRPASACIGLDRPGPT